MTPKINTATRNQLADSLAGTFAGGTLKIYTGSQPSTANDDATGNLIATITLPNPAFSGAIIGVASKTGTWAATVSVSGTAGWARFANGDDSKRLDVSCGQASGDISFDNSAFLAGGTVQISTFTITQPSS
jgi:hypothetical protein